MMDTGSERQAPDLSYHELALNQREIRKSFGSGQACSAWNHNCSQMGPA